MYIGDVSVVQANPLGVKINVELKIVILLTLLFWKSLQPFSSGLSHTARMSIRDITHGVAFTRLLACRINFHDFCVSVHWDQLVIFFHHALSLSLSRYIYIYIYIYIYHIFFEWQTLDDIESKYDSVFP